MKWHGDALRLQAHPGGETPFLPAQAFELIRSQCISVAHFESHDIDHVLYQFSQFFCAVHGTLVLALC
eukprot:3997728-Amphidinium_carterae.1